MKKIVLLSALLAISSALTAQEVQGPDGALKVNVELKDGNPIYSVHYILLCIVHYNEMLFYTHFLLQK